MNKNLINKINAALNNNHPVMENVDGLIPVMNQIIKVMPSNFGYAYLGYAYEKMNLIIDNAFIEGRLRTLIDEINEMKFDASYAETFEENAERMLKEFSNKYSEFAPMDAYMSDKFEICNKAPGEKCWNGGEYGFYSIYNASPIPGVYYVTTYTTCDIEDLGTGFEGVEYVSKDRYKELREMEAEAFEEAEREYDRAHGYDNDDEAMAYRHPLCLPGESIPLKDLASVDYDPLEEAHSMAALAIATGDEELMLKTLPNLGVYAFNAANQFYAKSVWVPGIGLVVPGTVIRFCSDGSYTGHTDPVYKSEHSDVYVVVRCSEQAAFKMLKAASIFVMSRLMTPDLVIIEDNYFYCDTEKYTFQDNWTVICPDGHIEDVESSWWRKEQCNFDYCAEATCQFQQYAMNFRSDYEFWFDLKEWYEYFDVEEV